MTEITLNLEGIRPVEFFGSNNAHLDLLRKSFSRLNIVSRGNKIKIAGSEEDINDFKRTVEAMILMLEKYGKISHRNIQNIIEGIDPFDTPIPESGSDVIVYGPNGNLVRARTPNQKLMIERSDKSDLMFAVGPAGTGKTYTAVALAVRALKNREVKRIVLTRPAVEAGESLGFLPGDLKEKVDPYLRPLYDALDDMIPLDKLNYYMQNRVIEVAPLAFMRGRTLDKAFIILDEAQNTTESQIKMFLTRLGPSAKCIVTGDLTQIDLPRNTPSGLVVALEILKKIEGIAFMQLTERDVIRHPLVREIIKAFGRESE